MVSILISIIIFFGIVTIIICVLGAICSGIDMCTGQKDDSLPYLMPEKEDYRNWID